MSQDFVPNDSFDAYASHTTQQHHSETVTLGSTVTFAQKKRNQLRGNSIERKDDGSAARIDYSNIAKGAIGALE